MAKWMINRTIWAIAKILSIHNFQGPAERVLIVSSSLDTTQPTQGVWTLSGIVPRCRSVLFPRLIVIERSRLYCPCSDE